MSRRSIVEMTPDEVNRYLSEPHLCTIGTIGPGGTIHLVAMNYGFLDGAPAFWTYSKAQKTKNLERDSTISMLVDSGSHYAELKGVSLQGTGEIVDDLDSVMALVESMSDRYGMDAEQARASALKRVAVKVHVANTLSWDHQKLGGKY